MHVALSQRMCRYPWTRLPLLADQTEDWVWSPCNAKHFTKIFDGITNLFCYDSITRNFPPPKRDDLDVSVDSLSWFIRLADEGNFTRAADELGISQQTLSARLASLEKELEAKLMVRSSPLTLTHAGIEFLSYAKSMEESRAEMLRRVSEASNGDVGLLKVAIGTMRGQALMPSVINEFHKGMPRVRIEIMGGTNEELLRLVERGEADIAVARFDRSHPGVIARPLFIEEVVLAMSPSLLKSVTGMEVDAAKEAIAKEGLGLLKDCPFLLEKDDDIAGRIGNAELKRAGIQPKGLVKCEHMSILLALCAQGLGAVFCPNTMLESSKTAREAFVCIPLSTEDARYEISIGRPANATPWTPAQVFEDIIGALFGE